MQPARSATFHPRAWAEVDLAAMQHNLAIAHGHANLDLIAIIKADAYGHGITQVARALDGNVRFLGVATVDEAQAVRAAGVKNRIFLLGPSLAEEREAFVHLGVTPSLSSIDEAGHFARIGRDRNQPVLAHLMIDTGMGREGFQPRDLERAWPILDSLEGIEIEGIATHLPSADEDAGFTSDQCDRFHQICDSLGGWQRFRWIHAANSAGLLAHSSESCNLARPGLLLYGIAPGNYPAIERNATDSGAAQNPENARRSAESIDFRDQEPIESIHDVPPSGETQSSQLRPEILTNRPIPVMRLMARVTLVRSVPPGHGISYGREFMTSRETRVATIGIGYGDGYPRSLSGRGAHVAIHGRRLPIIGRVTMDQIMVDATDHPDVQPGDDVELFGREISVSEVANWAQTIPWAILTGITRRVVRTWA